MLFYKTIDSTTLELLRKLQSVPEFINLRLVGGTSLALQIGHRKSIVIDLFGSINVDEFTLTKSLKEIGNITILKNSENIKIYLINGIKVDIVNYPYPWLEKPIKKDNLILADKKDIIAMKLAAITNRGRKKNFIDIYYFFRDFGLSEMLHLYNEKYFDGSEYLVMKSLTYFEDADMDEDPIMFSPVSWSEMKDFINKEVKKYYC